MSSFTSPFTGTVIEPTDVSYFALSFSSNTPLYWPSVVNPTQVAVARIMDCTPTTSGLSILLPEADQGAVGSDILFTNKSGTYSFTVTDASGLNGTTISPGASVYFYLTNNTTYAGVWSNTIFGLNTSVASASTLAGAGLTVVSGKLATTSNISQVSVAPTLTDASRGVTYVWTAGVGSITLPSTTGLSAGWWIGFRNNGTGTLTFNRTNTELINGNTNIQTNSGDSGFIYYDIGSGNFFTVGWVVASNVTFTAASYDVDSISGGALSLTAYAPILQTYVALSGSRSSNLLVTLPAVTQYYVISNAVPTSVGYAISFQASGSSVAPIVISPGSTATLLCTGGNLLVITQSIISSFTAPATGTAAAPEFTFSADPASGMYLIGTSQLGLAANGRNILNMNYTNTSAPSLSTPGTFTALLGISGGGF
jgi:hypothetical protein